MNGKKTINKLTLLTIMLIVLGFVFLDPIALGLCSQYDYDCDDLIGGSAMPIFFFSFISLIFLIIARWLNPMTTSSWLCFAKYYLPIAVALIFLSPAIDSSILGFDKEFMTWLLAGIFFITSFR